MDEEKLNEAARRNTNNEISTRIVKVIDWVMHTDWGRTRRLKGHRQLNLLLTLTEGKWHFVFFSRAGPCEQSAPAVTSETRVLQNVFFLSFWDISLACFWIFCTQLLIFASENTFDIGKISQLQNTNVIFTASLLIFIICLPTTDLNTGTDLNR